MKPALLLVAAACILCAGCQKEEVARPEMINPGGQASNLSPEEAARANEYKQAGERANAAMEEAARKMREANGGKG